MSRQISVYLLALKLLEGEQDAIKVKYVVGRLFQSLVRGIQAEQTVAEWGPDALEDFCADMVNIEIVYTDSGERSIEEQVSEWADILGTSDEEGEDD